MRGRLVREIDGVICTYVKREDEFLLDVVVYDDASVCEKIEIINATCCVGAMEEISNPCPSALNRKRIIPT